MKSKTKRRVCGGIAVAAVIFLLGTVGACDAGQISTIQMFGRATVGLFVFGLSCRRGGLMR